MRAMLGAHNWISVWCKEGGRLSGEELADVMVDTWLAARRPDTRTYEHGDATNA